MSDCCDSSNPCIPSGRLVCSCNQPSTAKLDPTTRAVAKCARCGYPPRVGPQDEVCVFEIESFNRSE